MNSYRVKWTQCHEATVAARNKEDALLVPKFLHEAHTLVCIRGAQAVQVKA